MLVGVLVLGAALWMVRAHWESVDIEKAEAKRALHERVLLGEAPDPYQYKNAAITHAFDFVHRKTGASINDIFFANTLLSLLLLAAVHHLWLRQWAPPKGALVGTFLLAALANVMFRTYHHHPYEFWGVSFFCLLLIGVARQWDWRLLCVIALTAGLVWEKQALIAPTWAMLALLRGERFWPTTVKALVMLASCLAIPVAVRLLSDHALTEPRAQVDGDTTLDLQKWGTVAWYQGTYVLPFLLVFLARFRRMPTLIRVLWLCLPVLVTAYLVKHYILHEVRSFWALAPVFTATVVVWLAGAGPRAKTDATGEPELLGDAVSPPQHAS